MDIGAWLRDLGLERYADAFEANAIDSEVLSELTEADLEKVGVLLGHRKKLLKAIAALTSPTSTPVADAPVPASAPPTTRQEAERRQLTVLLVDLVGSTALSARLDPEDMRSVIGGYQDVCGAVIQRYEAISPSSWATACSPISAGRRRMRTPPSGPSAPGWLWPLRSVS